MPFRCHFLCVYGRGEPIKGSPQESNLQEEAQKKDQQTQRRKEIYVKLPFLVYELWLYYSSKTVITIYNLQFEITCTPKGTVISLPQFSRVTSE